MLLAVRRCAHLSIALALLATSSVAFAQAGGLGAPPPPPGGTPPAGQPQEGAEGGAAGEETTPAAGGASGEGEGTGAEGQGTPAEGEGEGTPAAGEGEGTPAEGETPPGDTQPVNQLQLIVIDAAPYGIDPVVGRHVSDQMRATGAAMGYTVVSPEATVQAAQSLQMPYPPSPADLWRVSYASQSQRGAFARVWAHGGVYVIEITVASLDNSGPFISRGNAGASDLHAVVDQLLREALPPPDAWQPGTPTAGGATNFSQGMTQAPQETEEERLAREQEEAERRAREEEDRRRTEEAMKYRWHLVLQTEGAIGTSQQGFYNHLVGARVDFRVSRAILFGVYFAYANLAGKGGRADNIYFSIMAEDRIRISSSSDISIPLRVHLGYLPFNGPVIRLSAGINIPLSSRFELGFDLLAPTFWILPDRTAVSLNVAAELILRL